MLKQKDKKTVSWGSCLFYTWSNPLFMIDLAEVSKKA
jgi:hypothetical protein